MKKRRVQRWVVILEDRPSEDDNFYVKEDIHENISPHLLDELFIKSIKKETT